MAIEAGLRELLLGQLSIVDLVPPQTVGGIQYPCVFDEDPPKGIQPPFILIHLMDDDPLLHLGTTGGLRFTDIDIDCYGRTKPAARTLEETVSTFLQDYTGPAGAGNTINAVLLQDLQYSYFYDDDGRDTRQRIYSRSFNIQHT